MSFPLPHIIYIKTEKALRTHLLELVNQKPAYVAIDTEFTRRTTYWPQLELIQLAATVDTAYIIDCQMINDLSPLIPLFDDSNIVKVFHSARQDLEGFWKRIGTLPQNIVDTQIASAFLGCGASIGLNDALHHFLSIEIDKTEQHSHWDKRPLRPAQIQYAAMDVIYVAHLYPVIYEQLEMLGRIEWLTDSFQKLSQSDRLFTDPSEAWARLKNQVSCHKALYFLYYLAALREQIAEELDLNRSRVLSDHDLICLCEHLLEKAQAKNEDNSGPTESQTPWDLSWFATLPPTHQKAFERLCNKIQIAFPKIHDWSPFRTRLKRGIQPNFNQYQQQLFLDIKRIVADEANRLVIPASYLASTSLIENYVLKPSDNHKLVSNWRNPLLREKILGGAHLKAE